MEGKSLGEWSEKKTNIWTLCALIGGIITMVLGYGAWRSPHIDWTGFIETFEQFGMSIFNEINRMINDPFAFVGLIVMIVGFVFTKNNIKKLLSS